MKTSSGRPILLVICIAMGMALSWVSIYAFWFAVWAFHSLPAARASDAVGSFLLLPGKWVFELFGVDPSDIFYNPISHSGTNGLILGVALYSVFSAVSNRLEAGKPVTRQPKEPRRVEAKVG